MLLAKSAVFFMFFWLNTLFYYLSMVKGRILSGNKYSTHDGHKLASRWAASLFRWTPGWEIKIYGIENTVKPPKSAVLVANHESAVDILSVYKLNIPFRFLAKSSIFKLPGIGTAMRWAGYVPITRGDSASHKQALGQCAQALNSGESVLFFPEGTRSTLGRPKEFKRGAFVLAMETGALVQPIAIQGAGGLMKKRSLCPNRALVQMSVLPVVDPKDFSDVVDLQNAVRQLIVVEHTRLQSLESHTEGDHYGKEVRT